MTMSVPAAYLGVILIWSTTPLAIQWSTQGTNFAFAVFARMLIGVVVAGLVLTAWRISLPLHSRARRAYLVGGLGLFGGMALTYWGARFIHSGLVSVLFGLSPLAASILTTIFLKERSLTPVKLIGLGFGVVGLGIIFLDSRGLGSEWAPAGLVAVVIAVLVYTGSLVWLKHIGDDSPPLAMTVGTLAVSLPLFCLVWLLMDDQPVALPPMQAGAAIVYLGIFGSVIGFALYYYVIKHLDASRIALITLVTPVIALALGRGLNGEDISLRVILGTAMVLLGLAAHQWEFLTRSLSPIGRIRKG
jgi:drug/metabolite transporter (DMT)-like permease